MTKEHRRIDSARAHDDSDLVESMERAPGHGGSSGGNLQRNVAARAEAEHDVEGRPGVTRVHGEDRPNKGDRPNLPNR